MTDPQIFEDTAALQSFVAEQLRAMRRVQAEHFRKLSDEHWALALKCYEPLRRAEIEGMALAYEAAAAWLYVPVLEAV